MARYHGETCEVTDATTTSSSEDEIFDSDYEQVLFTKNWDERIACAKSFTLINRACQVHRLNRKQRSFILNHFENFIFEIWEDRRQRKGNSNHPTVIHERQPALGKGMKQNSEPLVTSDCANTSEVVKDKLTTKKRSKKKRKKKKSNVMPATPLKEWTGNVPEEQGIVIGSPREDLVNAGVFQQVVISQEVEGKSTLKDELSELLREEEPQPNEETEPVSNDIRQVDESLVASPTEAYDPSNQRVFMLDEQTMKGVFEQLHSSGISTKNGVCTTCECRIFRVMSTEKVPKEFIDQRIFEVTSCLCAVNRSVSLGEFYTQRPGYDNGDMIGAWLYMRFYGNDENFNQCVDGTYSDYERFY